MAEKRVIELEVKEKGLSSLKEQLAAAKQSVQDLANQFGSSSQQVADAADQVRSLEKEIKQTNKTLKSVSFEGKFNAISGSITGVLNGLQAFQGSLGLIGVEGKNVEAALLKVQSVMALTDGIEGVFAAQTSFKKLKTVVGDAASSGVEAFKNMTGASKAFALTGIGLVITAIGTVIAYWDDIKNAISGVSDEQEALNAKSQIDVDLQKEKLDKLDSQDNILKLQGKTERQILQLKIKQTDELIAASEIQIKNNQNTLKAQIEAEKRNKEILKGLLTFLLAPLNLLLKTVDEIGSLLGKKWNLQSSLMDWTASFIFDPKAVEEEGLKTLKAQQDALDELKNNRAGYQLEINKIDKDAEDARKKAAKDKKDKSIADEKDKNDKLKELAEAKAKFDLEQIELDEIRQEQAYQRKLDAAAKAAEEEKAQEDKYRAEKLSAEEADEKRQEDAYKRRLEGEEKLQELKYQAVYAGLTLISDLSEVFAKKGEKQAKKAFEIQKAASIAAAVITTYQSAVSAYQSQFLPLPDPTSPIRGAIAAGIAVAAGLGNVAKIASQKFESSGSMTASAAPSGGGGGGGGSVITPNFNIVGNAQATNPLAGLGGQPLQAYVVSGDVTTAQSLDRNRINYATFG
jgi:hypothetical protein